MSSRHYNMKWVDEEIFGNWGLEEATCLTGNPGGRTRLGHISQRRWGGKKASHICGGLVRQHGYELISCFLQGLRAWDLHDGENVSYPQNMTRPVAQPQILANE